VSRSYGRNAERLSEAKRRCDPVNVFRSAILLPVVSAMAGAAQPGPLDARERMEAAMNREFSREPTAGETFDVFGPRGGLQLSRRIASLAQVSILQGAATNRWTRWSRLSPHRPKMLGIRCTEKS
jgi:Berberine and berberine like